LYIFDSYVASSVEQHDQVYAKFIVIGNVDDDPNSGRAQQRAGCDGRFYNIQFRPTSPGTG
jgi:hypothetical protein